MVGGVGQVEAELAILVDRSLDGITGHAEGHIGFVQLEGELAIKKFLAVQGLGAFQLHLGFAGDGVGIQECHTFLGEALTVVNMDRRTEVATQIIGDINPDAVHCIIIGHAVDGLAAVYLLDQVVPGAHGIIGNLAEGEGAIGAVLHGFQLFALGPSRVRGVQLEGELAAVHDLAGENLVAGDHGGGGLRNILIGEADCVSGTAADDGSGHIRHHQLALQIVDDGDAHHILGGIVGDAIGGAAGQILHHHIVIDTDLGKGQRLKSEAAVGEVLGLPVPGADLHRSVGILRLIQQEGKLVIEQHPARKGLVATDGMGGIGGFVGVGKEDSVPHHVQHMVLSHQLAALIRDRDGDVIHSFVGGDAVAIGGGLHQRKVPGAHPVEGQLVVEDHVALGIVGAGEGHVHIGATQFEGELAIHQIAAVELLVHEVNFQLDIIGIVDIGEHGDTVVGLAIDAEGSAGGTVAVVLHQDHHLIAGSIIGHAGDGVLGDDFLQDVGVGARVLQFIVEDEPGLADTVGQLRGGNQGAILAVQSELESTQGYQGAAGEIRQRLLHVQIHGAAGGVVLIMEGDVDLIVACLVLAELSAGVEGDNLIDLQLAVHILIGDDNAKGVQGGIIGDAIDDAAAIALHYLIIIGTGGGELLRVHDRVEIEGGLLLGGGGGGDGEPCVLDPLLELELELCAVPVGSGGVQHLGALQGHIGGPHNLSLIAVGHGDGDSCSGGDGHGAVAILAIFQISGCEACAGGTLDHGGRGVGRQAIDRQLLLMGQGHGEVAIGIGGDRGNGAIGMGRGEGSVGHAHARQGHIHGKGHALGNRIVAAQVMANLLGDGQIAGTPVGVGEDRLNQLVIGDSHGNLGLIGHIVHRLDFFDGIDGAGSHARDVQGFACVQGHSGLTGGELGGGGGGAAVSMEDPDGVRLAVGGIGGIGDDELERAGGRGGIVSHDLAQGNAGSGGDGEPSVITQGRAHDEVVAQIADRMVMGIDEGGVRIGEGAGGILALTNGLAVQIHMDVARADEPGAIIAPLGRTHGRVREPAVGGVDAILRIHRVGAVHNAAGLAVPGVQGAIGVQVYGAILQIVVFAVLSGGVKVRIGVDLAIAGGIIQLILVGIEVHMAIGTGMVSQIFSGDDILHGVRINAVVQGHLVNQANRMLRAGDGQGFQRASLIQLHPVAQHRNQRRGHGEGHGLLAGGDALADLDGGVHHVGSRHTLVLIHLTQIAIGLNIEGRIRLDITGGLGNSGGALVPEAQELACGVGVPADVVGIAAFAVAQLAMLIGQANQGPGGIGAFQSQPGLDGPNHLVAQGGGLFIGAQLAAAGDEVLGQLLAGEEDVINQDALDITDVHILADLIHEGDIAGQIIVLRDQGGSILGHHINLGHNIVEHIRQIAGVGRGEHFVHIVPLALAGREGGAIHRGFLDGIGLGNRRSAPTVWGILDADTGRAVAEERGPILINRGSGVVGRIHDRQAHGGAQAEGIEQRIGLGIVGIHHLLGVGRGELSHEVGLVGVADGNGIVAHAGIGLLGVLMGRGGGLTVGHENHDRDPGDIGLVGHLRGSLGIRLQQLIHGIQDTQLGVSTGDVRHGMGGLGHGLSGRVLHAGIDRDRNQLAAGHIGFQECGGTAVPVQRQQDQTGGGFGLVPIRTAKVNHHADPVVLIDSLQVVDGLVDGIDHGLDSIRSPLAAAIHGAGQIQNHHGIRGGIAHAGNAHIRAHGRQRHQETVLFLHADAREGRRVCKDGFIRPYGAGILGVDLIGQEQLLPAIHGRRVRHLRGRLHGRGDRVCRSCEGYHWQITHEQRDTKDDAQKPFVHFGLHYIILPFRNSAGVFYSRDIGTGRFQDAPRRSGGNLRTSVLPDPERWSSARRDPGSASPEDSPPDNTAERQSNPGTAPPADTTAVRDPHNNHSAAQRYGPRR